MPAGTCPTPSADGGPGHFDLKRLGLGRSRIISNGTPHQPTPATAASGYRLLDEFVLPAVGWWENYYLPLADCLERFRTAHAGTPEALAVAERSQHEIDLYRRHKEAFGYVFFVLQRDDTTAVG